MSSSSAALTCDARVADGVVRGTMVGLLWGGFFGPSEIRHWLQLRSAAPPSAAAAAAFGLRYCALSMVGFAGFFGTYNGLLCASEKCVGRNSLVSPFVAGGTLGGALGATLPAVGTSWRSRITNTIFCATCTAVVSAASAHFLASSHRRDR